VEPGINEGAPLVYNGVMYPGNPADVIQAIDADSVSNLWLRTGPVPPAMLRLRRH
jgi:hypothetical protein